MSLLVLVAAALLAGGGAAQERGGVAREDRSLLVQTSLSPAFAVDSAAPSPARPVAAGLQRGRPARGSIWPVVFIHIPKTGGNFASTIVHSACSGLVPESYGEWDVGPEDVPAGCLPLLKRLEHGHNPLTAGRLEGLPEPQLQHAMAMFREPKQRLVSGFYHNRHDCFLEVARPLVPQCRGENYIRDEECKDLQVMSLGRLEKYAECAGTCQTRMLAGKRCGSEPVALASDEDLQTALDAVEGMGFVGLTEEYDLSICLFHTMFGGECQAGEFHDFDKGIQRQGDNLRKGYQDVPASPRLDQLLSRDKATYNAARGRFWRDVREQGITQASCAKLCNRTADSFGKDAAMVAALRL